MNQNNPLDAAPQLGYFLEYRHWEEALRLLKFQLEMKKKNRHFNTLEMFYCEKLEKSFDRLGSEKYFKDKVVNNLFYGLSKEFAVVPYIIPKSNLGLRQYKFMTCPMRVLYYAIGLYLVELSQEFLGGYEKSHKYIHANYGGNLGFDDKSKKLILKHDRVWYKRYYKRFRSKMRQEIKYNTERKVVIRLDIGNYFDELSIPTLLDLLSEYVKPSIQRGMHYDATTQLQLISFFDFIATGMSGIPQSDNNVISNFIGHLFLVFGDC